MAPFPRACALWQLKNVIAVLSRVLHACSRHEQHQGRADDGDDECSTDDMSDECSDEESCDSEGEAVPRSRVSTPPLLPPPVLPEHRSVVGRSQLSGRARKVDRSVLRHLASIDKLAVQQSPSSKRCRAMLYFDQRQPERSFYVEVLF
jgi:hypothetical protein